VAAQKVHHHAFVCGIEMYDENVGHAVARRKRGDKLAACIKPAGRSAYSDHGKISNRANGLSRARLGRFGLTRTPFWHIQFSRKGCPVTWGHTQHYQGFINKAMLICAPRLKACGV
jgi:hypothetical protein